MASEKTLRIAAILVLVAGCDSNEERRATHAEFVRNRVMTFEYAQDPRTGLCFALHGFGTEAQAIAQVPCSKKVRQLLK